MTWEEAAFLKLAGLGAIVMLPMDKPGEFLLQLEENGTVRPPGGHWEKKDKNLTQTIVREIGEEFAVRSKDVRKKIRFLGYEYRKPYLGNAVFEFKDHGLQPGEYQASNSKDEVVTLVKAKLDDSRYNGPRPDKLEDDTPETERAKQASEEEDKSGENANSLGVDFTPDYTPQEMEDLAGSQTRLYYHLKPHLASMKKWPSHWVPPGELDGWISWYQGYHHGNRKPGDNKEITRWKKLKARHGEELKRNPTPRRAWMMINWGIDPLKMVSEEQRPELQRQMDEYRSKVDGHAKKASNGYTRRNIQHSESDQKPYFHVVNVDSVAPAEPVKMAMDEDTEAWLEDMARQFPESEPGFVSIDKLASLHMVEKSGRFITTGELWELTRQMCMDDTGEKNPSEEFVREWCDKYLEKKHQESKEFFDKVKTADVNVGPDSVHREANTHGVSWDNDVGFMEKCHKLVGQRHLDDMTPQQLRLVRMSIRKDPDSWKSASTKISGELYDDELEAQSVIEAFTKWAGTNAPTLLASLKLLSKTSPEVQRAVASDLQSLTNQITAPTTTQVIKDFNPFGTPLEKRPQEWANTNVLSDIKAELQAAGTNVAPTITGLIKVLEQPKGLSEKWYNKVLTNPVNAGFSNAVMRVLEERLKPEKKSSFEKESLHERVIASAKEGTCPHCGESENMETSIVDGKIKCGGCGKVSSHVEWGVSKVATAQPVNPEWTGPEAIWHALSNLNLDEKETEAQSVIKRKLKAKRPDAVKTLNYIAGLKKMGIKPDELMISNVPVIPPQFRPYQVVGDVFTPGDANELYRDLINLIGVHGELEQKLGTGSNFNKLNIYDAMQALYGFGQPTSMKTRERGVSGFLKKVVGTSPKFSIFQNQMVGKTQDYTARGVVGVDPDLGLDQIGVPDEVLWKLYAPYIQRSLVRSGMSPEEGIRAIKDRTEFASRAMDNELKDRPVVYSRSPAWHKFNVVAAYPRRLPGNMIRVNPLVTTGMNMDFDGDAINIHLPSMPEAVKDAKEKLMPSKMLFSIKTRNQVMPAPKQEMVLGLWKAQNRPAANVASFPDEGSALRAIKAGQVRLSDEIKIGIEPVLAGVK